jgi:nucleoredoxin
VQGILASAELDDQRHDISHGPSVPGVDVASGQTTSLIGFYFGASWCPPCRNFSPLLSNFAVENSESFSVVLVSADHSAEDAAQFLHNKSFLSVPFHNPARQALMQEFGVNMFPTLVVCDARAGELKVVTRWGVQAVQLGAASAVAGWLKGQSCPVQLWPIYFTVPALAILIIWWLRLL